MSEVPQASLFTYVHFHKSIAVERRVFKPRHSGGDTSNRVTVLNTVAPSRHPLSPKCRIQGYLAHKKQRPPRTLQ